MGLERIHLHEKEGLALINGTQFMASIISQTVAKINKLIESSIVLYAIAVEVFGVDLTLFTPES